MQKRKRSERFSRRIAGESQWEQGQLAWHDPATGRHILTYDDQRARTESEHAARMEAAAQAEAAEAELRLREG